MHASPQQLAHATAASKASPAAAAPAVKAAPPWVTGAKAKAKAAAAQAVPLAQTPRQIRAALCAHLTDGEMHQRNKSAKRRACASHTLRYRNDTEYRIACEGHIPPTPEWLAFHSTGHTSRLDGKPGVEFPLG